MCTQRFVTVYSNVYRMFLVQLVNLFQGSNRPADTWPVHYAVCLFTLAITGMYSAYPLRAVTYQGFFLPTDDYPSQY